MKLGKTASILGAAALSLSGCPDEPINRPEPYISPDRAAQLVEQNPAWAMNPTVIRAQIRNDIYQTALKGWADGYNFGYQQGLDKCDSGSTD